MTSLVDIDITERLKTDKVIEDVKITENITTKNVHKPKDDKTKVDTSKEQNVSSKPPSRTVSPTKKSVSSPKTDKVLESPTKPRSISPRKPLIPSETSQSPQLPKTIGTKLKEPTSQQTKKPTSPTKSERVTTDSKKTTSVIKQNSFTKSTTTKVTNKTTSPTKEPDFKRAPTPKGNKENFIPKKDDVKVTRTASDASLKSKKPSPQRVKTKPEIQVNDESTKTTKMPKVQKLSSKEPQKLPSKPKSATTLNTSIDEDDVIIDVEQAKSSRENSPDRICPTPIGFLDDVGTPRLPDEVSEPDDDFRRRAHHTIHEAESIVDDIVEISEEDELFVDRRKTNVEHVTQSDEYLSHVNDKISKFSLKVNKLKPKETTCQFKDTEIRVHSDFMDENLKSDECLLSVSEKVNKFTKGPRDTKDKSPSRRIVDEYDRDTVYQDDYTKLSVNDKAHLFVETAESVKTPKTKPAQKVERPDLRNVDESLKSDECLLSVSDKVNKFVKTAERFLSETHEIEDKEKKIKEQHDKILKKIVESADDTKKKVAIEEDEDYDRKTPERREELGSFAKDTESSHAKNIDYPSPNLKPAERAPTVKTTTTRSSDTVKKAKAMFENIASTHKTKDTKIAKLTDIGVIKKSPKTDSTIVLHPSLEDGSPNITDVDSEVDGPHSERPSSGTPTRCLPTKHDEKPRSTPTRLTTQSPEVPRTKSPMRQMETTPTTTNTVRSNYPTGRRAESPKQSVGLPKQRTESEKSEKPQDKMPGYLRPTKTSQLREETTIEETEVSSRRGSGKFGVELRRTSIERSTASSERRRSSVEHHQPCIEDIFDLDLLEQMLEKVVGYEQRRRIRAQIRVVKKKMETEHITSFTTTTRTTKTTASTPNTRSPERPSKTKNLSPERPAKIQKNASPDRSPPKDTSAPLNGPVKEPVRTSEKRQRPQSPEKAVKSTAPRSPVRQPSPDKKTRTASPNKTTPKPKTNRFSEYASAYMKRVGLNEDKTKLTDTKTKKSTEDQKTVKEYITEEHKSSETKHSTTSMSKSFTERTSSKDTIEIQMNGKRSPKQSPERRTASPTERLYQRSPSPDFKRPKTEGKETIIKTVYEVEKKTPVQDDKPSWVTNRNLKKVTSETRSFSSKKIETEKKYRAPSPSKVISKPIDVITSSYGPGPLDADGRPLFGIRALRNGASNCQVKGTVIRQEFHSRNGSAPEGTVSVTAYSTEPEDLERLLQTQGERPSRIHGLAAITTTKKFGGETGTTLKEAHTKEEHAALEQFVQNDRRVTESNVYSTTESRRQEKRAQIDSGHEERRSVDDRQERREQVSKSEERHGREKAQVTKQQERREKMEIRGDERKTVRQSSVKSLTEKYIKSASESAKNERGSYPRAGLILRTVTSRDAGDAGLPRGESDHSITSMEDSTVVKRSTERTSDGHRATTTTTTRRTGTERSFLDSSTKVTGVQDILTRMKNADIVIEDGDTSEDTEARALLNKFLGATVLMAGMQSYVTEKPAGKVVIKQETVRSSGGSKVSSRSVQELDLDQCWDERVLKGLLDECTDYEQRRRLRARIRTLMAEQEACASAVNEALAAAEQPSKEAVQRTDSVDSAEGGERDEEQVTTVTSSVRRNSSEQTVSSTTTTTTKSSKVTESVGKPAPKQVSPFAKFRQLEKQNSTTKTPNSPATPQSPSSKQPYFKFTDPALACSALTIKERLLQWCRDKTRDYENVKLENFSTSWADGLAFCALVHHFLPDAFDYSKLTPDKRRHNFTLAFKVADEKAGIYPLLDVDDMVAMRKPDWKCVFTYVQAIHRRFKDQD